MRQTVPAKHPTTGAADVKRKVRAINVDGREFVWRVAKRDDLALVRVWDINKPRTTWAEFALPHTDPWLDLDREPTAPVRPERVAELIRSRMRSG